jgi:hypothetical protein
VFKPLGITWEVTESTLDQADAISRMSDYVTANRAKIKAIIGLGDLVTGGSPRYNVYRTSDGKFIVKSALAELNELQRPLRLPREHETGKRVIYIIVRYGHIYPCRNVDLSRNETDINWISRSTSEIAEPIQSRGIDPSQNIGALTSYFNNQSSDSVYVVFCVFDDSFPAFIRVKQLAVASKISYGWEPFRDGDGPVSFGEHGHTPKPQ